MARKAAAKKDKFWTEMFNDDNIKIYCKECKIWFANVPLDMEKESKEEHICQVKK